MFVLLLSQIACHTIEKQALNNDSAPVQDSDSDPTTGGPCARDIYVPKSGVDTTESVLADADAATFGAAPTPFQVHLSWAEDPMTSMSFVWRTDGDTLASQVQVGADTSYGFGTIGASFTVLGGDTFGRVHEAHVCGLTAGTTYHYRVGGEGHWSEDRTFTTAPAEGSTAPFRFVVAGDSRDNQGVWGQILDAAEAFAPDFYLFSGDAVDLGSDLTEWDAWLAEGVGHTDRRPVMIAHGNHEFLAQPFFALFALPDNEQWFSFDYGNAHFAFLNDTLADMSAQATWLDQDLKATTKPWKFAHHHQPAYSSCTTHGSSTVVRDAWSSIEEQNGVVVDFSGHNHNYERSVPLLNGQETDLAHGTTYVVSAGAGADLYGNNLAQTFTATATVDNNWVLVEINGASMVLTAYDLSGNVIDQLTATR